MSFSSCCTGSKDRGSITCHPSFSLGLTCKIPSCVKSRWLNHADVMTANFCRNGPKIGLKGYTKIRNMYIPITGSYLDLPDVPIQPLPFEQLIGSYPGSWLVNPINDPICKCPYSPLSVSLKATYFGGYLSIAWNTKQRWRSNRPSGNRW